MDKNFFQQIYDCVKRIPYGKVATYGDIAKYLGHPKMSRQVGFALHSNPEFMTIPCHRVVNRLGTTATGFAFGGAMTQQELLQNEGIVFTNNQMDLSQYRFDLHT